MGCSPPGLSPAANLDVGQHAAILVLENVAVVDKRADRAVTVPGHPSAKTPTANRNGSTLFEGFRERNMHASS